MVDARRYPLAQGRSLAIGALAFLLAGLALAGNVAAKPRLVTLWRFEGPTYGDGLEPLGGLVIDRTGVLYGTTSRGGTGPCSIVSELIGCGTVFSVAPGAGAGRWTERVLYSFQADGDGGFPNAPLAMDRAGALYGTAQVGGVTRCRRSVLGGCGVVFKLAPGAGRQGNWDETVLHSFAGGKDGSTPLGGLVIGKTGILGGTTYYGGTGSCNSAGGELGCGTVFRLVPPASAGHAWAESVLFSFAPNLKGSQSGGFPTSALAGNGAGALFGIAGYPFELRPPAAPGHAWTENGISTLNEGDSGLIADRAGALYGTSRTSKGGKGAGHVFRLTPPAAGKGDWTLTILYTFGTGVHDGYAPDGGLVFDRHGALYGTTTGGGSEREGGIAFKLTPPGGGSGPWRETILHRFSGGLDGYAPKGALAIDGRGHLFGTTVAGGLRCGCGTVFEIFQ